MKRYAAKGVPGGWRIWDKQQKTWWGERYDKQPDALMQELNGAKRPEVITALTRQLQSDKR